jgi:hypothetical protein
MYMKPAIVLLVFMLCLACNRESGRQPVIALVVAEDAVNCVIPSDVYLEEKSFEDTSLALHINIVLPKRKGDEWVEANKLFEEILEAEKKEFIKQTKEIIAENPESKYSAMCNWFEASPLELFCDSNFMSFCLQFSYQHSGGVHPCGHLYTFNYDLKKQKQITFADYFTLKQSEEDTAAFISLIWNGSRIEDAQHNLEGLQNVVRPFDFNVTTDTITFNFDDYEIASYAFGMVRSTISKEQLNSYINVAYR